MENKEELRARAEALMSTQNDQEVMTDEYGHRKHIQNLVMHSCLECGQYYLLPCGAYVDQCACGEKDAITTWDFDDTEQFFVAQAYIMTMLLEGRGQRRIWTGIIKLLETVGTQKEIEAARPNGKYVKINSEEA